MATSRPVSASEQSQNQALISGSGAQQGVQYFSDNLNRGLPDLQSEVIAQPAITPRPPPRPQADPSDGQLGMNATFGTPEQNAQAVNALLGTFGTTIAGAMGVPGIVGSLLGVPTFGSFAQNQIKGEIMGNPVGASITPIGGYGPVVGTPLGSLGNIDSGDGSALGGAPDIGSSGIGSDEQGENSVSISDAESDAAGGIGTADDGGASVSDDGIGGDAGTASDGAGVGADAGDFADGGMVGAMEPRRYAPEAQAAPQGGGPMTGGMAGETGGTDINAQVNQLLRNPQVLQQIVGRAQQLVQSGELTPQEITTMGQIAEACAQNPNLYPRLRAFVAEQGMSPLPPTFDPTVIAKILAVSRALQQAQPATPAGQVPPTDQAQVQTPQGLANGGAISGPGTGRSDSVGTMNTSNGKPVSVSNGEYIIPEHIVRAKGRDFFDKMLRQYADVSQGGQP